MGKHYMMGLFVSTTTRDWIVGLNPCKKKINILSNKHIPQ